MRKPFEKVWDKLTPRNTMAQAGKIERDQPDDTPFMEDEVVEMVMRFKKEAEDSNIRRKALQWWKEADRMVSGNHWDGDDGQEYQNRVQVNKIYPKREKLASLLIERLGETEILPRNSTEQLIAENVDNFFKHEFDRNNWIFPLSTACKKAIDHSVSWIKIFWDVHGDGGAGAVKLEVVSNYDLLLHEGFMLKEGKVETKYAIHIMEKTREEVMSIYGVDPEGEYQDLMRQGGGDLNQGTPNTPNEMSRFSKMNELGIGQTRPVSSGASFNVSQESPNKETRKKTYEVIECWYMDDSRVEGAEYDNIGPGGVPPLEYPHGRIITVCNGYKLFDERNPLGFFPWVPLAVTADPECGYVPSVINHAAGSQMELNKRRSQIMDHSDLVSNPKLIISRNSQIQQDTATNAPGGVWMSYDTLARDMGVMWLVPPPMPADVYNSVSLCEQDLDEITGIHEVNSGQQPSHARSGVAIERLQMEGMTRTNMSSMFFDQGIKTLVRNVITCYLDNVSDERQFRFSDPTTMEQQFGVFDPELMVLPKKEMAIQAVQEQIAQFQMQLQYAVQNNLPEAAELQPYIMSEIEKLQFEIQSIQELPTHELLSFDIRISTGTRNLTQSAIASMAIELFQLGAITNFGLLKMLDFPGWQGLLRMQIEEQQALAESQMAAQEEEVDAELEVQDDAQQHEKEMQESEQKHDKEIQKMKIKEATAKAEAQRRQRQSQAKKGK